MAQSWQWMPQRKQSVQQNHWVTSRFYAHLLDVAARQRRRRNWTALQKFYALMTRPMGTAWPNLLRI
jgi:hypothetical protein